MKKAFLEIGKIVSTSGLKGEVRVQPWSDSPSFLLSFETMYFDAGNEKVNVEKGRLNKNIVVLKLSCADTVEQANALRGRILYVAREDVKLDDRTYFVQDLIGLRVIDADDETIEYGTLSDVSQTGANDVYHIEKDKKVTLIPAIRQVIIDTDIDAGVMQIRPMKGLFDDED